MSIGKIALIIACPALFAASITLPLRSADKTSIVDSQAEEYIPRQRRIVEEPQKYPEPYSPTSSLLMNAGRFAHSGTYTQPAEPSPLARDTLVNLFFGEKPATKMAVDYPTWVPHKNHIALPSVRIGDVVYSGISLKLENDGQFSVIDYSRVNPNVLISAANYKDNTLLLSSLLVGNHRYTNATFQLNASGKFELVKIYSPIKVAKLSYNNHKNIALADPNFPRPEALGLPRDEVTGNWFWMGSAAHADLFQIGEHAVMIQLTKWKRAEDQLNHYPPNAPSQIYVFKKNSSGRWQDETAAILPDTTGCIAPGKAVIADFNVDGQPDVFYSCSGYDGNPDDDNRADYGENDRLLLSEPDGRYRNIKLPFVGYSGHSTAGDLNGDNLPDLIVANTTCLGTADYCNPNAVTNGIPYVLINKGDGQFELDMTRLPKAVDSRWESQQYYGIYTLELIDIRGDGIPDLFIGGSPLSIVDHNCTACFANGFMENDGSGFFNKKAPIQFPLIKSSTGATLSLALDFLFLGNSVFFHQESPSWDGVTPYEMVVSKIDLRDMSVSVIYTRKEKFLHNQIWPTWLFPGPWMTIISKEVNCNYPIEPNSTCGFSIDIREHLLK